MALIDIGSDAQNRGTTNLPDLTYIEKRNPANEDGKITSVELYFSSPYGTAANVQVATFFVVSGNNLSTRDTYNIGSVSAGSKQTKVVSLDVKIGDYIGLTYTAGRIETDGSGGSGVWYDNGDQIPCTNNLFSLWDSETISIYGTGETVVRRNAIFMGCNF